MDTISEDEISPPPPWSVLEFTFHNEETDSELVIMCNYHKFIISISSDSFSQSPALERKYLFFLKVAENFELDGYTVEDFYDWIAEPLLPKFRQLPEVTASLTLQDFLFPETSRYNMRGEGEILVAIPSDGSDDMAPIFGIDLPEESCVSWPQHDPKDIQLPKKKNSHGPPSFKPSKVLLKDGNAAYFKPMRPGDERIFLNELNKYRSIRDAHLDESLRISRLIGLVRDESGLAFGLLLTYIDCGNKTLLCATQPDTPGDLRQKWAEQVHDLVHHLHTAGIVWGDVKPDNVLIDRQTDAWLIDFGGGYTHGWVPKELAGSVEGDLHGLQKIEEFLRD
ncbi:hypothetical protein FOPG_19446 [Fusarium oxysporum f. sp. conglutinans race 2 54008]|uniref:Protein kinase domain-containing protein n=3 Tax=Fusarium oxysporum f. sp. conglutinans TaxID=100902 RepID=F9GCP2_FUSOF|nr:hypothetical protein FOXB_16425 [Fusarium oxysporum f. sp. conglutinans Fo5176]EXL64287.1 hypothetical protein FOPG_19446 [Fusarium oxysporum f. sp. conglutinans race 2 54008]KAG6988697.1 Receptor-interacting serine/threonine-protein kinase 1 [Fusarium oxysporum f. sp. conglutinans]KAH7462377.1 hypothetical protein FOMA001_g18545 [Fusarium oxysporum f. sp. matthiolae]KAI8397450.1 hypothetical protein FOFC_20722 [Fusarium oxysporum]